MCGDMGRIEQLEECSLAYCVRKGCMPVSYWSEGDKNRLTQADQPF